MRRLPLFLSASATALAASLPALAADGEISSVLLSSGGLAEVVRDFDATGSATIGLTVPAEQVDDVLKSVVVADPGGTVTGLSLVGSDSVAEAFRTLPFGPADLASTAAVAAAMRGFEAEVDDGEGSSARGVILGVTEIQRPSAGAPLAVPAVSLLLDTGAVRQVLLGPAATLTFADADIREKIAAAGRALRGGKDGGGKTIEVETEGDGARQLRLSYVTAAPVWKVSYRAIAGPDETVRIQGWAILENATGEDWAGVRVTLSSSNPVALRQRLYDKYWRPRTEIPIALPGGPANIGPDDGSLSEFETEEGAYDLAPAPSAPVMAELAATRAKAGVPIGRQQLDMANVSRPSLQIAAVEGDVGVTFTIPTAVDLQSGHTLSVPIIDASYEAELVSLWQPETGSRHPVATLFLTNGEEGSLPPGIFTVFDGDGYLGDAQILGIPPGETRFAAYASDPKVTVDSDGGETRRITSGKVSDGVLVVVRRVERRTSYTASGPKNADRTLMIDHPRQIGWDLDADARVVSDNGGSARLRTRLEGGKPATVTVRESRIEDEHYRLLDQDFQTLLAFSQSGGIDPALRAKLAALAERRRAIAVAEDDVARIDREFERLDQDQGRVRLNLSAVPSSSELAKTYLAAMAALDSQLAETAARRDAAEAEAEALRKAYEEAVATF